MWSYNDVLTGLVSSIFLLYIIGLIIMITYNLLNLKSLNLFCYEIQHVDKGITNFKIFVISYHYQIVDKYVLGNNYPFIFSAVTNENRIINVSHVGRKLFFHKCMSCFKSISLLGHRVPSIEAMNEVCSSFVIIELKTAYMYCQLIGFTLGPIQFKLYTQIHYLQSYLDFCANLTLVTIISNQSHWK